MKIENQKKNWKETGNYDDKNDKTCIEIYIQLSRKTFYFLPKKSKLIISPDSVKKMHNIIPRKFCLKKDLKPNYTIYISLYSTLGGPVVPLE